MTELSEAWDASFRVLSGKYEKMSGLVASLPVRGGLRGPGAAERSAKRERAALGPPSLMLLSAGSYQLPVAQPLLPAACSQLRMITPVDSRVILNLSPLTAVATISYELAVPVAALM